MGLHQSSTRGETSHPKVKPPEPPEPLEPLEPISVSMKNPPTFSSGADPELEHGGQNRMKPELEKYGCRFTLDPNTAHPRLSLSEGNRRVDFVREDLPYMRIIYQLDHPERFDEWSQVLSVESVSGPCYWEAEWSGKRWVCIAVCYIGIRRKGNGADCRFGRNDQSWSLEHCKNHYTVLHNNKRLCTFPHTHQSGIVGVYVDWPAGTLSFYNISPDTHTLTLIHTLHTTFTEPLYTGISVEFGSSVCLR